MAPSPAPPGPACVTCACSVVLPAGNVGNVLRVAKQADGAVLLGWSGATVSPPRFAVYRTTARAELSEDPAGIGDEPQLAVTTSESFVGGGGHHLRALVLRGPPGGLLRTDRVPVAAVSTSS